MKNHILIIALLLFIKSGWSQNTNIDYKYAIKAYILTTFEEYSKLEFNSSPNFVQTNTTQLQLLHPTIAFQWKTKKNNFHEIELTNLTLNKVSTKTEFVNTTTGLAQMIGGDDITSTLIALQYEYILNFNKSKDHKLVPSLGFAISPYFKRNNYSPLVSNSFPASEMFLGARTSITPRITYFLSSRLFFDLNIPVCLFDTYYLSEKEENPSIAKNQRTTSSYNFALLPQIFSGRLGIGLNL